MSLPKISTTIYDIIIPGTKETIKFRPMVVKEYKALLQAQEFGQNKGFINTISAIIDDCLFNKVNIDELPMYIIDYIFLKIRAKSIGEVIKAEYQCNAITDVPVKLTEEEISNNVQPYTKKDTCGCKFQVQINLDDAYVNFPENYHQKNIIQITDSIGIQLKSPTFKKFRSIGLEGKGIFDITDEYVYACIDTVFEDEKIYVQDVDFNFEELQSFTDNFPAEKIKEITEFFQNQPIVMLKMNLTCPKCGNQSVVELKGLKDFFD